MEKYEHGGQIKKWTEKYNLDPQQVIDFSANINPMGIPKIVKDRLISELDHVKHYPDQNCEQLKHTIGKTHELSTSQVVVGNGASEIIDLITMTTALNKSNFTALIINPTFSEYHRAVQAYGGEVVNINSPYVNKYFTQIISAVKDHKPDLVFICSPNNPTGELISDSNLKSLIKTTEELNTTLIIDHSFMPFVAQNWRNTANYYKHGLNTNNSKVVFLYSLTKIYSIPGIRIGYAITSKALVNQVESIRNQWSVNHLAQVAAEECLAQSDFEQSVRELIYRERAKLISEFEQLGFTPHESSANFILVKNADENITVDQLWKNLARRGIFIRKCENFPGLDDSFFRIAVRLPEENERLVNAIHDILSDLRR